MNNQWIAIFQTGKQTDSRGKEREWTEEDLDQIVESYNPEHHEAPVVIGHPKDNAPAWGWAGGLKREGKLLYAKFKNVVPEFADMVQKGLFKKRSISLYPDLKLRHVGFLGAQPPAVKGLPDIEFSADEDEIVIEFDEWKHMTTGTVFQKLREWIIEKFGIEDADKALPAWAADDLKTPPVEAETPSTYHEGGSDMTVKDRLKAVFTKAVDELPDDLNQEQPTTYSEADLKAREEAAAKKARDEAKAEAAAEFAEKQKADRAKNRTAEVKELCDKLAEEGVIIPAWQKMGLAEFMQSLDGEEVLEFAEESKVSQQEWFKSFLSELPKVVNFKEVARREDDVSGDAAEKLTRLVTQKMEKEDGLTYSEALLVVQREHPELAVEYQQTMSR